MLRGRAYLWRLMISFNYLAMLAMGCITMASLLYMTKYKIMLRAADARLSELASRTAKVSLECKDALATNELLRGRFEKQYIQHAIDKRSLRKCHGGTP